MNYSNLATGQGYSNGIWNFLQNSTVGGVSSVYNNWSTISQGFGGLATSHTFTMVTRETTEIQQGGNCFLAATDRIMQVMLMIESMQMLLEKVKIPGKTLLSWSCHIVTFGSIPLALLVAAVQGGEYEKYRSIIQKILHDSSPNYFSEKGTPLSPEMKSASAFLADNWEIITRTSMAAIAVGLMTTGNVSFGAMLLANIAYEVADKQNYLPLKVSMLMERYVPMLALIGVFVGKMDPTSRFLNVLITIAYVSDDLLRFAVQKVDKYSRAYFKLNFATPTLEAFDAPLEEKRNLSYAETIKILDTKPTGFEINPAHCPKPVLTYDDLPQDKDYNKFLTLFDGMNFLEKYNLVGPKLKDDDRFILFLVVKTGRQKEDILYKDKHKDNFTECLTQLAAEAGKTKEQYAVDWTREQLDTLTKLLKGEIRVEGTQGEFFDSVPRYAIMNHYLHQESLPQQDGEEDDAFQVRSLQEQQAKEDFVLRLAIECGAYCGTGQDDRSEQLLHDALHTASGVVEKDDDTAVIRGFEQKVRVALYRERQLLLQEQYQEWAKEKFLGSKGAPTDIHLALGYQAVMGMGFIPQSNVMLRKIGVLNLFSNMFTKDYRDPMYVKYSDLSRNGVIHAAVTNKVGNDQFVDYIQRSYHGNKNLSDDQKETLDERLQGGAAHSQWSTLSPEEQMVRFHNVMLYQMGIIRMKQAQ